MHTLVIGGTGMLAGATKWLAEKGHHVSVVSRGRQSPPELAGRGVRLIAVDYRESQLLRQSVADAISQYGPIELAIFWIHSDAPGAFGIIADGISRHAEVAWRLIHVRGSAAHLRPEVPPVPTNCLYREVLLGFVAEETESRWLTHEEISGGVIDAIQSDRERTVVGTLEPWERRPR